LHILFGYNSNLSVTLTNLSTRTQPRARGLFVSLFSLILNLVFFYLTDLVFYLF